MGSYIKFAWRDAMALAVLHGRDMKIDLARMPDPLTDYEGRYLHELLDTPILSGLPPMRIKRHSHNWMSDNSIHVAPPGE